MYRTGRLRDGPEDRERYRANGRPQVARGGGGSSGPGSHQLIPGRPGEGVG
jgi:hypothetical protein